MKKKWIVGIILLIFSFFMVLNFYKVEAYSGELDPESYITLPYTIYIKNQVGTGTITLSSRANGYNISYQKVDISQATFNNIKNKAEEVNKYIEESNNTLKEKEANAKTLNTEYQTLKNSGTATEEQLTQAKNKYDEAYQNYQEFYNTVTANATKLENEYYALIPNYTSQWTSTTNTSNNVSLDFKDYTGTAYFVLWAKIENGTNTYYDMKLYSPTIQKDETVTINKSSAIVNVDETIQLTATSSTNSKITWTSSNNAVATVSSDGLVKGVKEGTAIITAKGSEKSATCTVTVNSKDTTDVNDGSDGNWTDFTNAKFNLKKDGMSSALIEISNITPKENRNYYLFITSNSSKPNVSSNLYDERIELTYDVDSKMFKTTGNSKVAKYVELNQDLYVSILEREGYENEKVVLYGKKLERYEEPKYSDAFHATFLTNETNQIVTAFTHAKENNRKIQIKIGKITDKSILQKIKNKDSSGFAKLLSYAKVNDGIYDKTVDADKDDPFNIGYNAGSGYDNGNSLINLKGLQNEEYYFLYIKTDDENGKYISSEAVTLAQANVYKNNNWYLFFYGSSDFKWADFGNVSEDNTVAGGTIPQTGISLIWTILGIVLIGGGMFSYIQYRKNNF